MLPSITEVKNQCPVKNERTGWPLFMIGLFIIILDVVALLRLETMSQAALELSGHGLTVGNQERAFWLTLSFFVATAAIGTIGLIAGLRKLDQGGNR